MTQRTNPPPIDGHTAAILTVSDGVASGHREDVSGAALVTLLEAEGYTVVARGSVPDEAAEIGKGIKDLAAQASLVVTTGGTGFGPRDVTPEATQSVLDRAAPGLVFLMLSEGIRATRLAALSRPMAGTCGSSLVVNLPGSPKGAVENLTALLPVLPHALTLLAGDTEHRRPPSS